MNHYCIYSGKLMREDEVWLPVNNRAFMYGDGLFETMYFNGIEVELLALHFNRLMEGMKQLKLRVPEDFTLHILQSQLERLAARNKLFKPARVRLQVYRESEGFYTPKNDNSAYLIQMMALPDQFRLLNGKGLVVEIYPDNLRQLNRWSGFKSLNSQLFVQAGIWKRDAGLDDCIILNQEGRICEATSSNIFLFDGHEVLTPSLAEGCIPGVMRTKLLQLFQDKNLPCRETALMPDQLWNVREVFLSNAIQGIRWVGAFKTHRYYNSLSTEIFRWLQED